MPKIPVIHGFGVPHEPAAHANEARSQSREGSGAGPIAPASVAPAEASGFVSRPAGYELMPHLYMGDSFKPVTFQGLEGTFYIKGRSTPTGFYADGKRSLWTRDPRTGIQKETSAKAHLDIHGEWVLDEAPAPPSAPAHPEAGPSRAPSSRATIDVPVPHFLEDVMRNVFFNDKPTTISLDGYPSVHPFSGQKLPSRPPAVPSFIQNRLPENHAYAMNEVASFFLREGYRVEKRASGIHVDYLEVTNPKTGVRFPVYVKLTASGRASTLKGLQHHASYLIAAVRASQEGTIHTLYFVPIGRSAEQGGSVAATLGT
ncbi:MAG TPA: hypothetical protein VME63_05325 [Dyella sp.]|uniref:hypothetical protein n=1 Tax=Dyella sp. TaxID=1869338 RepID=UPI002C6BE686|nr:hypothetical protein [Dyella sp.]HTV84802.1 hypothetical protein [Dyella sp.]